MLIYKGRLPHNDRIDSREEMALSPAELTILSQIPEILRVSRGKLFILLEHSTGDLYEKIRQSPRGSPISPTGLIKQKIREYIQMLMIENALAGTMKNNTISLKIASIEEDFEQGTDLWLSINKGTYPVDIVQGIERGRDKIEKMSSMHASKKRIIIAIECEQGVYSAIYTLLRKSSGIVDLDKLRRVLLRGIGIVSHKIHITIMNPPQFEK